eukprot:m.25738 g.25738  ORF g.25738 m.25738 type:complete len:249 (-) comp8759_c0_seq2:1117-1863(-)
MADEFAKQLEAKANSRVSELYRAVHGTEMVQSKTEGTVTTGQGTFYAQDYFDSDDEDEEDEDVATRRLVAKIDQPERRALTNDELFYDPDMDDEDMDWVAAQRSHESDAQTVQDAQALDISTMSAVKAKNLAQGVKPALHSDAILNCPACLAMLCLDCQRHDIYPTQFRAMFVENCAVTDRVVHQPDATVRKQGRKDKRKEEAGEVESDVPLSEDVFRIVECATCGTEVAAMGLDEVVHFYNVVESRS